MKIRMMLAALIAAALGLTATVATPAAALLPFCATRAAYRLVHRGEALHRVDRELRQRGYVVGRVGLSQIRDYHTCRQLSDVTIQFSRGWRTAPLEVVFKTAQWSH